jgi:LPS-assembly lipoprotein
MSDTARAVLITGVIFAALGVSGCGFTPLYATPGLSSGLSSVQVVAPDGRVAYLIREDLDDDLAHDKSAPPAWRLTYTVNQTRGPRGLNLNDIAERYEIGVTVNYTLTNLATGAVAHTGKISSELSYDSANAPYAGIAARQDTQQRVASDAARRIQLDLAAWMSSHPNR